MKFITSQEAADKWGLTRRSVQIYCANGRIHGAINPGKKWLIPENAEKPVDTRFRSNKNADADVYHFPLLVFTKYFLSRDELTEDESFLLDAQIMNMQCRYSESITICRRLTNEKKTASVRMGAWFTNAFNFMILGLGSEINKCMDVMRKICAEETTHQDDFRLILAYSEFHLNLNAALFYEIQCANLSADAFTTYQFMSICLSHFASKEISEPTLRLFEGVLRETEISGIAPMSLVMHSMLAMIYVRKGNDSAASAHISEVCKLGFEGGFDRLLGRTYHINAAAFNKCLIKYGNDYAARIVKKSTEQWDNWRHSYNIANSTNIIKISIPEYEIVVLMIYKMSIREIAIIKNITEKDVKKTISDLCTRFSLNSKNELMEMIKESYSKIMNIQLPVPARI